MINQVKKVKGKTEKHALKVMHTVDKNHDGTFTIDANAPKLREAVGMGPDPSKLPPIKKPSTLGIQKDSKPKREAKAPDQLSDEQHAVLKALHELGGKDKDIHTMDIAKHLHFDKEF